MAMSPGEVETLKPPGFLFQFFLLEAGKLRHNTGKPQENVTCRKLGCDAIWLVRLIVETVWEGSSACRLTGEDQIVVQKLKEGRQSHPSSKPCQPPSFTKLGCFHLEDTEQRRYTAHLP